MNAKSGLCTFVHVPKTGGITLYNILSRFYHEKNRKLVQTVKTPLREEATSRAKRNEPFLIQGHLNITEVLDIPGNFIFTFLRSPVSRVISHYYFLKEQPTLKHYEYLNRPGTTIESFYALKEKKDIDNCLVRYISGLHETPFGEIGQAHYDLALENLQSKIHFFGVQEHYDESLILLAGKLGWPLPIYRKKNLTKKKDAISPATFEFLHEANKWDVIFYQKAQEMFAEKLSGMTVAERKKLVRLRMMNKLATLYPF
jgi:hypothetical protein